MNDKALWRKFKQAHPEAPDHYEAWAFGGAPDKLAKLVLEGVKTATASADILYDIEEEHRPAVGDYSVILNSKDEAVCVIRTTKLYVKSFLEVSEEHAYKEGEGDRSLQYWRIVHKEFFSDCFEEVNLKFTEDMKVLCEEFEVVYRL